MKYKLKDTQVQSTVLYTVLQEYTHRCFFFCGEWGNCTLKLSPMHENWENDWVGMDESEPILCFMD